MGGPTTQRPTLLKRIWQFALDLLINQWFLFALGIMILLAYLFPSVGKEGGHVRAEYSVEYGAVALIFLVSGMQISTKTLIARAKQWKLHLVAQGLSFLVTPAIIFAVVQIVMAAKSRTIDFYVLVGMVITGCTPTTVSSNVVMTRSANGDDSAALIEVTIGNIMGTFITPALVQMFLSGNMSQGKPLSGGAEIYRHVFKQLGLSVFIPLFVGQVLQNVRPKEVKWALNTFKLPKVGSFCLVLLVWATFSNAFAAHSFEEISTESVILVVFCNIGFYAFFTVICFCLARLSFLPSRLYAEDNHSVCAKAARWFRFTKRETIAICFCGAAKTVALGIPLIHTQYTTSPESIQGILTIPLVLYQGEQILVAQLLVPLFKRWVRDEIEAEKMKAQIQADDGRPSVEAPGMEPVTVGKSEGDMKVNERERSMSH